MMTFVLARLREASTWAGIGTVLAGFGINLPPGLWQNITGIGIGVAGVVAFVMRETAKTAPASTVDPHAIVASDHSKP